jgi:probable phosphoglycerate mutase
MHPLIYLIRHGEIDTTTPRRFLGQSDPPLNTNGIHQAKRLGAALSTVTFGRIYASPLSRAMQTAALVGRRPLAQILPLAPLTEINLGAWEGLSVAEVRARFPGAYEARGHNLAHFRPPEGESFSDVASRALPALLTIVHDCKTPVLIVAHAGVNRALLSCLQSLELNTLLAIPQDYCGVNILENRDGRVNVLAINQTLNPPSPSMEDAMPGRRTSPRPWTPFPPLTNG